MSEQIIEYESTDPLCPPDRRYYVEVVYRGVAHWGVHGAELSAARARLETFWAEEGPKRRALDGVPKPRKVKGEVVDDLV